jgi:hypothetical protein
LYILIYKILPKYIYSIIDRNIAMQPEAYFHVGMVEVTGELEPRKFSDDPFGPPRRLGKRPLIAM